MEAVLLMFPGQGSQHPRMAWGLYGEEPGFTAAMDEVFAAFGEAGAELRRDWLSERPRVPLDHVTRSQPLLFAIDYALGRTLLERGVRPWVMLGHSIGEMAAAVLAGVFTLADAVALVRQRVRLLAASPPGGMLAVSAGVAALEGLLTEDVVVAAENAPRQTIVAGPSEPLAEVERALRAEGFTCAPVPTLIAFHSPSLAATVPPAVESFAGTPVGAPRIPLYSGYAARPMTLELAADPGYWARHPVAPVRFWPALDEILSTGSPEDGVVCVEAGPGQGLSTIARRHRAVRKGPGRVVPLLPARAGGPEAGPEAGRAADRAAFATALTALPGEAGRDEADRHVDDERPAPLA
ncbi:acyltransferase domain-containing protein [Nonomuraea sp. NPDC049709]|uniref:acyltransferase domain-containing protein n=1 Tax=Nonomuraea sp. NPDC049709 TaxID=3154736 RepID=UPI00344020CB